MRKNIFLHFLNRDSREIFGINRFHNASDHASLMKSSLNAAMLLCEDFCIMPPGFAIEDQIAFGLFEINKEFLSRRLIKLPMREANLADYAEKKRVEYMPQRDRYSGLFSDRRLEFLGKNAVGIIGRKSKIGERIIDGWESAADTNGKLWKDAKLLMPGSAIESVRGIASAISDDGAALTWAEISQRLPEEASRAHTDLRNSLQHIYFREYCREFTLQVLCELPFLSFEFGLPTDRRINSYDRFAAFLETFELKPLFLNCSALALAEMKCKAGVIAFLDAYAGLAVQSDTRTNLLFNASRARKATTFDWTAFKARHEVLLNEPNGLALAELDDALAEAAAVLANQNGLLTRSPSHKGPSPYRERKPTVSVLPELVVYVALDEELEILVKRFKMEKGARNPVASGTIGTVPVHVISPRSMGRVSAAVEIAKYLESRRTALPRLILVLGLAGGFEEEGTQPGHIICASTVVDLASRKVQDADEEVKIRFRRRDYPLDDSLGSVLMSDFFPEKQWIETAIEGANWPKDRRPSLHHGLLASVDEVIASDEWRGRLLASSEKLLGVEMEAGGVCAAASSFKVPVSMLRAVSDSADPVKADTVWRHRGMTTISMLVELIPFDKVFESMGR